MILGTLETNAQTNGSRFGQDSVRCVTNLALYRDFYKQKKYKDALGPWRYVFNNCPRATENIFINGINMYNVFIAEQKDSAIKKNLVDTLMMIYDLRIKYYDNEGKHLANKANDLLRADSTRSFEAYGMLKKSITLLNSNSEETTLINFCSTAISGLKAGQLQTDAIIDLINRSGSIIDFNLKKAKIKTDSLKWNRIRTIIDANTFPLLQCNEISALFRNMLSAEPQNLGLLKRITEILFHRGCTDDSLYLITLERTNALEPNTNTAFLIAREYLKQKNSIAAVARLTKVAEKLKDNASKAVCYYYLGVIYAEVKDFPKARTNALKAIQLKSDYGEPYLLIADCYARSSSDCGNDNITSRYVYWCAVDKVNDAKRADPKLTVTADNLITQYTRNFPTKEMLASKNIKSGTQYQVGCWINETTLVRIIKEIKK